MNLPPSSRAEALRLGIRTYFTGKPCKRGHIGLRYTQKGNCVECAKHANPNYTGVGHKKNATREAARLAGKKTYFTGEPCIHGHRSERYTATAICVECCKAHGKAWTRNNRERNNQRTKAYYHKHPDKLRKYNRDRYAANPTVWKKNARKRKERLVAATPPWAKSGEVSDAIAEIYACAERLSAQTGVAYHVDHIYPLHGENSCGLHVPWNLQILTAEENIQKSNQVPSGLAADFEDRPRVMVAE